MFELSIVSKASEDGTICYMISSISKWEQGFFFFNALLCCVVRDIRSTGVVNECCCGKLFSLKHAKLS
jgi:hypothetical protein